MIDKSHILGFTHFAVTAVLLRALGFILPTDVTCFYSGIANFILFTVIAASTFDFTKRWCLNERLRPENRAVFITGCDTGFGHNAAKLFHSLGYSVFAGCLDENSEGAKKLKKFCSQDLKVLEIDVRKDSSVKNAADYVKSNLGTSELCAIVNNAGVLRGFEVDLTDIEDFKETMEVNGFGPVRVTKAFLPLLKQSKGRVVNISSMAGRFSLPYVTPYSMSKHASVAFSECLKAEMDSWGIQVISIEPVFVRTNLNDSNIVRKQMDISYKMKDKDIAEDYGEQYRSRLRSYIDLISWVACADMTPVLNSIHEAVSLKYPNSVYRPRSNILSRILYYFIENAPDAVRYAGIKIILRVTNFPRPQKAERKTYL